MSRSAICQLAGRAGRTIAPRTSFHASKHTFFLRTSSHSTFQASRSWYPQASRSISTSRTLNKGLQPGTDDPQPPVNESNDTASAKAAADISTEEFHELSDLYLNALVEKLEALQEEREEVDVEYSAGVLNLTFPPNGTYVLNKQPPNKQIWLSSPITGPKRFDFVMASEGQDAKEGTGAGEWIYLRDGTTLSDVLLKEVGVDMLAAVEETTQ